MRIEHAQAARLLVHLRHKVLHVAAHRIGDNQSRVVTRDIEQAIEQVAQSIRLPFLQAKQRAIGAQPINLLLHQGRNSHRLIEIALFRGQERGHQLGRAEHRQVQKGILSVHRRLVVFIKQIGRGCEDGRRGMISIGRSDDQLVWIRGIDWQTWHRSVLTCTWIGRRAGSVEKHRRDN